MTLARIAAWHRFQKYNLISNLQIRSLTRAHQHLIKLMKREMVTPKSLSHTRKKQGELLVHKIIWLQLMLTSQMLGKVWETIKKLIASMICLWVDYPSLEIIIKTAFRICITLTKPWTSVKSVVATILDFLNIPSFILWKKFLNPSTIQTTKIRTLMRKKMSKSQILIEYHIERILIMVMKSKKKMMRRRKKPKKIVWLIHESSRKSIILIKIVRMRLKSIKSQRRWNQGLKTQTKNSLQRRNQVVKIVL